MFTSDDSLIDDARLTVSDNTVEFTVSSNNDTVEVYEMPASDYADSLSTQAETGNILGSYK